jgi:hypothetical protein
MNIIKSNFGRWYAQTPIGELSFDHEPKLEEIVAATKAAEEVAKADTETVIELEAEDGEII